MFVQRFNTPRPVSLELALAGGDIHVTTVDGDESSVTLEGPQRLLDATRVELDGDRLSVKQQRSPLLALFDRVEQYLRVEVSIPDHSRVEIATASAETVLAGSFSGLTLRSASGGVRLDGALDGDASVKTVSGRVRLAHVTGELSVRTVSGNVAADSFDGAVSVKSVSGRLDVSSLRDGSVDVQSVSGDVMLGIAPGTCIDIDAGSASGELTSEIPLSGTPEPDGGPTVVIRGNTASGNIRIVRAA